MELTWYRVEIKDFAKNVFTKSFFPQKENDKLYAWITDISDTPNNGKVLIASKHSANSFRILTKNLAHYCFENVADADPKDQEILNGLLKTVKRNL